MPRLRFLQPYTSGLLTLARSQWVSETARAQFLKGNEASPILIPEREPHAAEALQQRHTVHAVKFGVVVECPWQAVIRDAAAQVVDMMHADVCREPAQDSRQVVV